MGTNYYVIKKPTNDLADKLWKARNTVIDNTEFTKLIYGIVLKKFKRPLLIAEENDLDYIFNKFEDDLKEAVQKFTSDIEYNVSYNFDLRELNQVHIGKSSAGWLFNFQHQDTEIDGVKIKWHSYEDVMSFLKEWVSQKKEFVIIDEYNRKVSYTEFKDLVDTKQKDPHNLDNPDNFHYCDNVKGYRFSSGDFS